MARLKAQQGDVTGGLVLYSQSLEIKEQIGDAQGKAATLHQMAGLRARQGDAGGALALYRQSMEIKERIGDPQGKAATMHNMAALAYQQGDQAGAVRYGTEAAGALARVRAWPGLLTALNNLSVIDAEEERRLHWLAQAVWLPVALRLATPQALTIVSELFQALPSSHPRELRLAALAGLEFAQHGPEELRVKNLERANQLFGIAAGNQGMTPEAAVAWLQEQMRDPGQLRRETLAELEALVGKANEDWSYNRQAVLESMRGGSKVRAATADGRGGDGAAE